MENHSTNVGLEELSEWWGFSLFRFKKSCHETWGSEDKAEALPRWWFAKKLWEAPGLGMRYLHLIASPNLFL